MNHPDGALRGARGADRLEALHTAAVRRRRRGWVDRPVSRALFAREVSLECPKRKEQNTKNYEPARKI